MKLCDNQSSARLPWRCAPLLWSYAPLLWSYAPLLSSCARSLWSIARKPWSCGAHLDGDDDEALVLEEVVRVDGDDSSLIGLRHVREDRVHHRCHGNTVNIVSNLSSVCMFCKTLCSRYERPSAHLCPANSSLRTRSEDLCSGFWKGKQKLVD